jgi:hypothetical protein
MGCAGSKLDPVDKEALRKNATIDRMIRLDKKISDRTIKILLLGTLSILTAALLVGMKQGC